MNNARRYSSIETVRTRRSSGWLAVSLLSVGCVVPRPEAKLPTTGGTYVAVLSGEMPPPIDTVARHSWIVTHRTGSTDFRRFELGSGGNADPFRDFAAGDVMVHGIVEMTEDEPRRRTLAAKSTGYL